MEILWNLIKAGAGGLDGQIATVRFGIVSSFDPNSYLAKVMIQPENVLSGWLPVLSPWVGAGWGLAAPLLPGTQVVVLAQEGDAEQGVIAGALWSSKDSPLTASAGELWLRHKSGSQIKLNNNGNIELNAPTVTVQGNLMVSGDISDQSGTHGTLRAFQAAYDQHVHHAPGGITELPSEIV
ncbi:phage baseplate assembly protein V [Acidocella sp.]|uniref:phage baseplate assembly protein V n=1 Tax=Acidocella sp. TaxID=50710 RepID=UPI002620FB70|nr:phage baseplate assembly protein V [Acidocella sp.]